VIDRKWIGHELPASVLPDRAQPAAVLRKGDRRDRPGLHRCRRRATRYPDFPAPPTFLFAAELDSGAAFDLIDALQIPIAKLLHGEQSFSFHKPACVGDTVTVRSTVSDIYDKKNGALEFVVKLSRATNQRDELVAELRSVLVCKN
jgi:hypothetical protein